MALVILGINTLNTTFHEYLWYTKYLRNAVHGGPVPRLKSRHAEK